MQTRNKCIPNMAKSTRTVSQTEKYFRIEMNVARMCRRAVCMQNNAALNIELIYGHTP